MTQDKTETGVRAAIDALIDAGTSSDLSALDQIYHADMAIHMIDTDNNVMYHDKPSFIEMLKGMVAGNGGKSNTWAEFHRIDVQGDAGHVLITRKVDLGGHDRILVLSIDLVFEDARWQVMREVIFSRPNTETTPA